MHVRHLHLSLMSGAAPRAARLAGHSTAGLFLALGAVALVMTIPLSDQARPVTRSPDSPSSVARVAGRLQQISTVGPPPKTSHFVQ